MIHWRLTSAQFQAAVFATGRDRLPYPIRNDETGGAGTDLGARRRAAIESLLPRIDDDFALAVRVLVDPQARVHLDGRSGLEAGGRAGAPGPEDIVKAYAGFAGSVAAVAVQAPGDTGEVTVSLCGERQALGLLARQLPPRQPGGNRLVGLKADLDAEPEWVGGWSRPPTLRQRIERFRTLPRIAAGEALVYSGPFLDNTIDGVTGFHWMDLAGDGRYYVREDDAGYAITPMSEREFADHLGAVIWRVRELAPVSRI